MRTVLCAALGVFAGLTTATEAAEVSLGDPTAPHTYSYFEPISCEKHALPAPQVENPKTDTKLPILGANLQDQHGELVLSFESPKKWKTIYCEVSTDSIKTPFVCITGNCSPDPPTTARWPEASPSDGKQFQDINTKLWVAQILIYSSSSQVTYWGLYGYH